MTIAGDSGTPLAKKIGIKEGDALWLVNPPENYPELLTDLPDDVVFVDHTFTGPVDIIHIFCSSFQQLIEQLPVYISRMKKDGMLWISWPKGKSGIKTDLDGNLIRDYVLLTGLVDTKVVAIDEIWSGLKFVYRLKDR